MSAYKSFRRWVMIGLVAAAVLQSAPAVVGAQQDCFDYASANPIAGWHWFIGRGFDSAVAHHGIAYALGSQLGDSWVTLLDASDPTAMVEIAEIVVESMPATIRFVDDRAFIHEIFGSAGQRISIWDVSDPHRPLALGAVAAEAFSAFRPAHDRLYTLEGDSLCIYDATDPHEPARRGAWFHGGGSRNLEVKGSHVIVNVKSGHLIVVDVGDPAHPVEASRTSIPAAIHSMTITGDHLVTMGSAPELTVYDLSALPAVTPEGVRASIPGQKTTVEADGDYVLVSAGDGVHVLDASRLPDLEYLHFTGQARDTYWELADDGFVYAMDSQAFRGILRVVDYRIDPRQPGWTWSTQEHPPADKILVREDRAYMTVGRGPYSLRTARMIVFDIEEDGELTTSGSVSMGIGNPADLEISDGTAVMLSDAGWLTLFGMGPPRGYGRLGEIRLQAEYGFYRALDLAVHNQTVYVGTRNDGNYDTGSILAVSIADPSRMRIVDSVRLDGNVDELAVVGDVLVAAVHPDIIQTFDLKAHAGDPASPSDKRPGLRPAGEIALEPGWSASGDMIVVGDVVYSAHNGFIYALDCRVAARPRVLGTFAMPDEWYIYALSYADGLIYVSSPVLGVTILDISDPTDMRAVGYVDTEGETRGIAASGDDLFVSYYPADLRRYPAQCGVPADVFAIDVLPHDEQNRVLCRDHQGLLPVAVLSTPGHDALRIDHTTVRFGPAGAGEFHRRRHEPARHEVDIDHDGDLDLLFHFRFNETGIECGTTEVSLSAETYDGDRITGTDRISTFGRRGTGEAGGTVMGISPNPFNPQTTISFTLAAAGPARIEVFDVRGRRVRTLADGAFAAGTHEITWRGDDDVGQRVASGVYMARLTMGVRQEFLRMLLMK